ncbi:MAG: M20/M25/M40 family metallo-hydrolase [Acidobacteriota bacterium]
MTPADWHRFAEKYRLATESSIENQFDRGTSGLEVEFNILDGALRPVDRVGFGPESRSFADVISSERLPDWARRRIQLEVFHWMTEIATRPYYSPQGAVYEARILEGVVANTLAEAGLSLGERFYMLHGNIPYPVVPDEHSIPGGWSLAKKRYLARCVELFGGKLATAGIHTNHSLPESLLSWDFFHLPRAQREKQGLADYRSEAMIRATRLLRPYCALFIGISAASPLSCQYSHGSVEIVLTDNDSNRLLTFPNPEALDVPRLYASHPEYLRISFGLVRSGVRFGGNNWTPVRARSDVDPVNRIISTTSDQLRELYRRGIYSTQEHASLDEAERALVIENLCAIVDLPMSRVEVRTDEGGDDLDLAVAKVAFKELLLIRGYADPEFGAGYMYDVSDVTRARRNEEAAARRGLSAEIEHPFTGARVAAREWLASVLRDLEPLSEVLGYKSLLEPLWDMARGSPNPAGRMREWFSKRLDAGDTRIVPHQLLREWLEERERIVAREIAAIASSRHSLKDEAGKLAEILQPFEAACRGNPTLPVQIAVHAGVDYVNGIGGVVGEVLSLATALIRIPSVTNCENERLGDVFRCARLLAGTLRDAGAQVRLWDEGKYPALLAGFPGTLLAPVTIGGHFDVVMPDPNDSQFEPRIEGDYLWGRGSADMKTVVATYVVWMRRAISSGPPYPPVNLLLVGNEENGEAEPYGTPHVLRESARDTGWSPDFMIIGERTGERGDELFGEVCTSNRGVMRLRVVARGERAHTGMGALPQDLLSRLIDARRVLSDLLPGHFTLSGDASWRSSATFPFLRAGEVGVYNITADEGVLGLEVRPIPEDDPHAFLLAASAACAEIGVELAPEVVEGGIACPPGNPHLARLLRAVEEVSLQPPRIGRKLAGTSARFAPGGCAVVWGQSGIGPHSRHERHYIPSIEPYLRVLDTFAALMRGHSGPNDR